MKKLLLYLLFVVFTLTAGAADHLEFMGIPIDGTISSFQTKLLAKGCKVSEYNREMPTGIRRFEGIFAGEDAAILVWYDTKTKIVYWVRAVIDCGRSIENAHDEYDSFKNMLNKKYSGNSDPFIGNPTSEKDKYNTYGLFILGEPNVEKGSLFVESKTLGAIMLNINEYDGYPKTYGLFIDYIDDINNNKAEQNKLDDL